MQATNIPYLFCRNGIYYYRNQSVWKSLKTRCKKEAFTKMSFIISGNGNTENSNKLESSQNSLSKQFKTQDLIKMYIDENSSRWCAREVTRVYSTLSFLPNKNITREVAIQLKLELLKIKTVSTFNRYLKYFNSFYRWVVANHAEVTINPFDGLKVVEKKVSASSKRNSYTKGQLKTLFQLADKYGKDNMRYWLIMIGRYTGARMNEICQLKPSDITSVSIFIRGDILKNNNAKRRIPIHPKLIQLGILDWVAKCTSERLFHEWKPIKGSFSHAGSKWFSRNNPFKIKGVAVVDFHSLRHTVATELKSAGVPSQFTAQILGHSNGNITYDRYGKDVDYKELKSAILMIE
jgi:integrase